MTQNENGKIPADLNRRAFIKGASFGSMMLAMGGVPLLAEEANKVENTNYSGESKPISFAVIGCGVWGREVIQTLGLISNGPVVAICDIYKPLMNRAKEFAPKAELFDDYKQVLELKTVDAVIIATPSFAHREIVEAALKAGKHVYCEVPLAHTIEDAKAIAKSVEATPKSYFQCGLQRRSDPSMNGVLKFIRNGAIGKPIMARSQAHKKESWRRPASAERDKAINWRLNKETSNGLVAEIGVHQLDLINWFLNEQPVAATGFGSIMNWDDGRDVPDTVQTILQYPGKANFFYDCTRCNSFDGEYDMIYGTFAAIMVRGSKAWLFKETDSPVLGIEVYSSTEKFYKETGISLAADATKSVKAGGVEESPFASSALHHALKAFIVNANLINTAVKNFFVDMEGEAKDFKPYLDTLPKNSRLPAADCQDGVEATITAIKANEAVMSGEKVKLSKDLFAI